ncbi:MAG: substrate-binding domain-containing protein [Solirubrobacteraceae bacterium]
MTRYLEIARGIAAAVQAGELEPGAELPSVRDQARERRTTASTVARAYRHLAEAGLIDHGDRRRARVAPEAAIAARRLLGSRRELRLAGSDDPALDLVLRRAGGAVVTVGARGSFQGLTALWRGSADAAAIHLLHRSGVYNAPFASALLRGRAPALIHLWRREQGLLLAPGNPDGIRSVVDLRGLRVAKREFGAGTRVLLDRLLADAGIPPHEVPGPETASHLEVALAVASGLAAAGVGVRAAAAALGLDFLPLVWEEYDIVLPGEALAAAASLIDALLDPGLRASIEGLGGYDASGAGEVRSLPDPDSPGADAQPTRSA